MFAKLRLPVSIIFILLFVVVLVWGIILQMLPDKTTIANYGFNLGYACLYLVGAIIGIGGSVFVTTQTSMGKALLSLGVGMAFYVIALLIWAYFNLVAHVAIPFPSAADIFFILFYPLMAIGGWNFLTMVSTNIKIQYMFEVMAIFFVTTILFLGIFNVPDTSQSLSVLSRIINIWYPLGDSLLVALSYLVFRASRENFQFGILLLIVGLLVQVVADTVFAHLTNIGAYWNGDVSDILFAVSGFILSFGILRIFFDFIAAPAQEELHHS